MNNPLLPPPPIQPFDRLRATDGLLINAERWRKAHEYHRQRQNFHYQSLHQPGIVCGLGVSLIATDSNEPPQYRDGRGVKLLPGIAIDLKGNPIIVPDSVNVQIAVEPPKDEPLTVYLVVSYRDPDELTVRESTEIVREQFRVDVKTQPPSDLEVEVCRLNLPPAQQIRLQPTEDVFFPSYFNLDFRFRDFVSIRPQGMVRLAQIKHNDPDHNRNFLNLDYLLNATETLYWGLRGLGEIGLVTWEMKELENYDLLYLTGQKLDLQKRELEALKRYLSNGGVLFVDCLDDNSELNRYIQTLAQQELKTPLKPIAKRHPLRRKPFFFAGFPLGGRGQPITLLAGGGIILSVGNLGAVWGLDEEMTLAREIIRTAQELGVNILHYAWQRRMMTRLQLSSEL